MAIADAARCLTDLEPIKQRVTAMRDGHTHGVIYAVRMEQTDVATTEYSNMGVSVNAAIPVTRLHAKILLPPDIDVDSFVTDDSLLRKRIEANGILALLSEKRM
jgi:hypothetical protein